MVICRTDKRLVFCTVCSAHRQKNFMDGPETWLDKAMLSWICSCRHCAVYLALYWSTGVLHPLLDGASPVLEYWRARALGCALEAAKWQQNPSNAPPAQCLQQPSLQKLGISASSNPTPATPASPASPASPAFSASPYFNSPGAHAFSASSVASFIPGFLPLS